MSKTTIVALLHYFYIRFYHGNRNNIVEHQLPRNTVKCSPNPLPLYAVQI